MEALQQAVASVIIPVYNAATYLKECIESVLAQSYPAFELILIDDGSQDDSLRIHLCPATEYLYRQSSGSLTHRLHPYTEAERALKYLDKSFKDVSEHFTIKSTSYEREINAFLCSTLFRTITYTYRGAVSNQEKLELLRRLAEYKKKVTSADIRKPLSLRVMRWIYLYLPKTLQHVIFSTFYYLR